MIRQCFEKSKKVFFFIIRKLNTALLDLFHQWIDGGGEFYFMAVELKHLFQGFKSAIVHIGCCKLKVTKGWGFKFPHVVGIAGHHKKTFI